MGDLPVILAGPIVRRIEQRLATFWVALSKSSRARAHIWEGGPLQAGAQASVSAGGNPLISGEWGQTLRLGERLFIALVTVKFPLGGGSLLRPGATYSYNIEVEFVDGGATDLAVEGLLTDEMDSARPGNKVDALAPKHLALGYQAGMLPTFVTLPVNVPELRFAHASCRKPHGPGYDALAWLDNVIDETKLDTARRPQVLFLTGDQIYADDVPACLLPTLNRLGRDLLGRQSAESVPSSAGAFEGTIENFPALRRQKLATNDAHFTSTEASCHLLTFAEYAAMYLISWSPRVWRALASADEIFKGLDDLGTAPNLRGVLTDWERSKGGVAAWRVGAQADFDAELANVQLFRKGVPHVARALANVATYMILDDHEVTDDWNLNGRWIDRVYSRPLGKWIVANAMMACGAFQGWGNDPLAFSPVAADGTVTRVDGKQAEVELTGSASGANGDRVEVTLRSAPGATPVIGKVTALDANAMIIGFESDSPVALGAELNIKVIGNNPDLLTEVAAYTADPAPPPGPSPRLANLCGFGDKGGQQVRWHYALSFSTYTFVVMDSRTRRKTPDHFYGPPSLLGDSLNDQIPDPGRNEELLVLISPAPVVGPQIFEQSLKPITMLLFDAKAYSYDRLTEKDRDPTEPKPTLTSAEEFDAEGWGMNEVAQEALLARVATHKRVVILSGDVHYGCSLEMEYWRKGQDSNPDRIAHFTSSPAHNGFDPTVESVLRQNASLQKFQTGAAAARLYWVKKAGIDIPSGAHVTPGRRARLAHAPTILPASGWPSGMTIPPDKAPDGRWILKLVRDVRPDGQLPEILRQAPLAGGDLVAANPLPTYGAIVNRHGFAAMTHFNQLRQMVFSPNLGIVRIDSEGTAGKYKAVHTLLSRKGPEEPESLTYGENTVQIVSLSPTGGVAPTLGP